MAVTNKKELLDALASDGVMQGFELDGVAVMYTMFEDVDRGRAKFISKEIEENLIDYLRENGKTRDISMGEVKGVEFKLSFTPISFIKALLRNVELNSDVECLHSIYEIAGHHTKLLNYLSS